MFFVLLSHLDSSCCQSPRLHVFLRADQWVFSNRRGYHFHKSSLHHQNNSFFVKSVPRGNSKQQAPNYQQKTNSCGNSSKRVPFWCIHLYHDQSHASGHQTNKASTRWGIRCPERIPRIKASSSGISSWRTDS